VKVVVDRDKCQEHGQCCDAAPAVFQLDKAGRLHIVIDEPDESMRGDVEEAADVCPMQAITVVG
jgi:ferredoxin